MYVNFRPFSELSLTSQLAAPESLERSPSLVSTLRRRRTTRARLLEVPRLTLELLALLEPRPRLEPPVPRPNQLKDRRLRLEPLVPLVPRLNQPKVLLPRSQPIRNKKLILSSNFGGH